MQIKSLFSLDRESIYLIPSKIKYDEYNYEQLYLKFNYSVRQPC